MTIDELCLSILAVCRDRHFYLYRHLEILYDTGCRGGEVINPFLWSLNVDKTKILLQTEKTGVIRQIDINSKTVFIKNSIENNTLYMLHTSYSTLKRVVESSHYGVSVSIGSKECITHIFRHNKAKQLYSSGASVVAIAAYLGITTSVAARYVFSNVVIE